MASRYSEIPDYANNAKTSGSQAEEDSYFEPEGTKSRVNFVSKIVLSAALLIGAGASLTTVEAKWDPLTEKKIVSQGAGSHAKSKSGSQALDGPEELPTLLSARLQKEFGFKTAQWAAVLNVERKTLYNWIKNPETRVQQRVANRLELLKEFLQEIDTEHAGYVPKFAFGRYLDRQLADALKQKTMDLSALVKNYERLYADFDGRYKRDKHKRAMPG